MLTADAPGELRLLLACARSVTGPEEEAAIRRLLEEPIDWTRFVQKLLDHGVAALVGHKLATIAPDMLPPDLLEAFRTFRKNTNAKNRTQFAELTDLIRNLAKAGIDVIPIKGPFLAIRAYHDISLRVFRDLDFLLRDEQLDAVIEALHRLGYERQEGLTETQFDLIHRVQGQEIIFNKANGTCLEPHTRLTSAKFALDIDHEGLWRRARRIEVAGQDILCLAPEDEALALAIHGGKEKWWSIKWAADFAAFLAAHPDLDWDIVIERARQQGCLRMLLLAVALVGTCLDARIPATAEAAIRADPMIARLVRDVVAHWQEEEPREPAHNAPLSLELLRLHDRILQRWRYTWRSLLLPGPSFIASFALPRPLAFAYIPLKLGHDLIALPLYRAYCACAAKVGLPGPAGGAGQQSG